MKKLNTKLLMKIHLVSASFMLPIALLFLITGCIYFISEFSGNYIKSEYIISLNSPITKEASVLKDIAKTKLDELNIKINKTDSQLIDLDKAPFYQLEWNIGLGNFIRLLPTSNEYQALLVVEQATLYKKIMLLHTAYGNNFFRIYAIFFALLLFSMFLSGYIIAWKMQANRNIVLKSTAASIILFILIILSQ